MTTPIRSALALLAVLFHVGAFAGQTGAPSDGGLVLPDAGLVHPVRLRISTPEYLSPVDGEVLNGVDAEYLVRPDGSVWMAFQEEFPDNDVFDDGRVWLARIDPESGQCTGYPTASDPATCRQGLVASNAMQIATCAWKGPNFGLYADAQGDPAWRLFYHLSAQNGGACGGRRFIVSRDPDDLDNPVLTTWSVPEIQTAPSINRANGLASQDASMPQAFIAFLDNDTNGGIAYQQSGPPHAAEQDPQARAGFRWVAGKRILVSSASGQGQGPALDGEIQATDVVDGITTILTGPSNNPGGLNHVDAYGWLPPEYPETMSVVARIEGTAARNALRVYRQAGADWVFDRTLSVPNDRCDARSCAFDGELEGQTIFLQSWEPFQYDGRSYFVGSVKSVASANPRQWPESEIWLLSYDGGAVRLHPRWPGRVVHEGEAYVTSFEGVHQLFVSYNEIEREVGSPDIRPGRLWRVGVRRDDPVAVAKMRLMQRGEHSEH